VAIGTTPQVRRVRREDVEPLAEVLRRAFRDDPMTLWMWPDRAYRPGAHRRWFRARLRFLVEQDQCYTTDDHAGAALWALPRRWAVGPRELLAWAPMVPSFGRRTLRVVGGMRSLDKRHPRRPPHFYLAVLGTDPPRQGRGVGSALMGPVLAACDRDAVPAYLETTTERNVDFYSRHGWRVTEELRLPEGPPLWLMWRDPR
jgi:GNAT superfamily N-acetyltransferase